MIRDIIPIPQGSRFRAAMLLAVVADVLQIIVFPLFVEGAISPADDILDLGIGAMLVQLLGWHWEFLPSFLGKLVPGVIWFLSGRWRLQMSTGSRNRNRSRLRERARRVRLQEINWARETRIVKAVCRSLPMPQRCGGEPCFLPERAGVWEF